MWCSNCQSEQQVVNLPTGAHCAKCRSSVGASTADNSIRQARDIIAKWSSSDLLDQISALPEIPMMPAPHFAAASKDNVADSAATEHTPETDQPVNSIGERSERIPKPEPQQQQPATDATEKSDVADRPGRDCDAAPQPIETAESDSESGVALVISADDICDSASQSAVQSQDTAEPVIDATEDSRSASAADDADNLTRDSSAIPTPQKRRLQARNEQRRKQRNRKAEPAAVRKGSDTVRPKFRVDIPGQVPTEDSPAEPVSNSAGTRIQSNSPQGGRRQRIDSGEAVEQTLNTGDTRSRAQSRPRQRYVDEAHPPELRGPHFQVTAPRRSNLTSITGQFLAYLGVLGLTIGTAMVIYGHFGGYSQYTPTGWLVTTVAQMMLFLGVINLVSGGIEQTNDDVSAKINHLGEQLMRIEQVTEQAMRGPRIDPRRYLDAGADLAETRRETVPHGELD